MALAMLRENRVGKAACSHCPFYTTFKFSYNLHLVDHKSQGSDGAEYWECRSCWNRFGRLDEYVIHLEVVEGFCEWREPKNRSPIPSKGPSERASSAEDEEPTVDEIMDEMMEDIHLKQQIDDDDDESMTDIDDEYDSISEDEFGDGDIIPPRKDSKEVEDGDGLSKKVHKKKVKKHRKIKKSTKPEPLSWTDVLD